MTVGSIDGRKLVYAMHSFQWFKLLPRPLARSKTTLVPSVDILVQQAMVKTAVVVALIVGNGHMYPSPFMLSSNGCFAA